MMAEEKETRENLYIPFAHQWYSTSCTDLYSDTMLLGGFQAYHGSEARDKALSLNICRYLRSLNRFSRQQRAPRKISVVMGLEALCRLKHGPWAGQEGPLE